MIHAQLCVCVCASIVCMLDMMCKYVWLSVSWMSFQVFLYSKISLSQNFNDKRAYWYVGISLISFTYFSRNTTYKFVVSITGPKCVLTVTSTISLCNFPMQQSLWHILFSVKQSGIKLIDFAAKLVQEQLLEDLLKPSEK